MYFYVMAQCWDTLKNIWKEKKHITTKYEKKINKKKLTDKNTIVFIIAPDSLPIILYILKCIL